MLKIMSNRLVYIQNVSVGAIALLASTFAAASWPPVVALNTNEPTYETTPQRYGSSTLQREDMMSGWNDLRIALRGGRDRMWSQDKTFTAAGVDASYVRRNVGTKLVRMEAGGTYSYLTDNDGNYGGYNFHGTFFPAIEVGALVIGPRALLGANKNDSNNNLKLDAGGEGRIGFELSNFSIFAAAGRTTDLTRVGIDLGATF